MSAVTHDLVVFRQTRLMWLLLLALGALSVLIFSDALGYMVQKWDTRQEYSYGYLIPVIVAFLIWQKKEALERMPFTGSWSGVAVLAAGMLLFVLGELSTLYVIVQYAFLVVIAGTVIALVGWRGSRLLLVPLLVLSFMIPLPEFLLNGLSAKLQLVSSQLGVAVIRLFGISVFLEGNVIDLGAMKLQVVEACSGLRYLFPLMVFGFITAHFFKAPLWQRAAVFLSTIPLTILMNSFRIGVIGVTVEYFGAGAAEGFLHDFEGWIVFMACTVILFGEMWLLSHFSARRPLREVFGLELPAPTPVHARIEKRALPSSLIGAVVVLAAVAILSLSLPERAEVVPARDDFVRFPLALGDWTGKNERLQQIYVDTLKFDDYLLADFADQKGHAVNLYSAYYGSQRKGESVHSPRTCIPGGGWEISDFSQREISTVLVNGQPLQVNRAVIQMREQRQLVYYWFQQRGRVMTNEYLVKWYLFWDALTRNRSDGALVRVTTMPRPGQPIEDADFVLQDFLRHATPQLAHHIPD